MVAIMFWTAMAAVLLYAAWPIIELLWTHDDE